MELDYPDDHIWCGCPDCGECSCSKCKTSEEEAFYNCPICAGNFHYSDDHWKLCPWDHNYITSVNFT